MTVYYKNKTEDCKPVFARLLLEFLLVFFYLLFDAFFIIINLQNFFTDDLNAVIGINRF